MKLGKFSMEAVILGVTLLRSYRAIMVITLYLVVASIVGAGLVTEFEHEVGDDELIDDAKKHGGLFEWAAALLTNTQGNLVVGASRPEAISSQIVIRFIGIIKGFIFFLPLGMMTNLHKCLWADYQMKESLKQQVARERSVFVKDDWTRESDEPWVRISVYSRSKDDAVAGVGFFNVPLLQAHNVEATVLDVPVRGHGLSRLSNMLGSVKAEVQLQVWWRPSGSDIDRPRGQLGLSLLKGANFPGRAREQWMCSVQVPVRLECPADSDSDSMETWGTGWSSGSGSSPIWACDEGRNDCTRVFAVDWQDGAGASKPQEHDAAVHNNLEDVVLEKLGEQSKSLQHLQRRHAGRHPTQGSTL
jgi:hypothetical protein